MKKVLILEDEVNIRSFVVINLKRAGYEAIEAESGEEALAQALREGKLGVMDYYNMKNIMADTEMRNAVAQAGVPKTQSVPTGQDSHHDDRGPAGK